MKNFLFKIHSYLTSLRQRRYRILSVRVSDDAGTGQSVVFIAQRKTFLMGWAPIPVSTGLTIGHARESIMADAYSNGGISLKYLQSLTPIPAILSLTGTDIVILKDDDQ